MKDITFTRRDLMISGGVLALSPFASATVSANNEHVINYSCDIPNGENFDIEVTVREKIEGANDGYNYVEYVTLEDGEGSITLERLNGGSEYNNEYNIKVEMYSDGSETPYLHDLEIEIPDITNPEYFEWIDDFGDGNIDGWSSSNPTLAVDSGEYYHNGYSLYFETHDDDNTATWDNGPVIDLNEGFIVRGVLKFNNVDWSDTDRHVRVGVRGEEDDAFLSFNDPDDITFLAIDLEEETPSPLDAYAIEGSFTNKWVNFMIESERDDSSLTAKVWEIDESEPEEYQMERDFTPISGEYVVNCGADESNMREMWLDRVEIQGEEYEPEPEFKPDLRLNARNFVELDKSIPYEVRYNDSDDGWITVTDEASVNSNNPDIVSVDADEYELIGEGRGETSLTISHDDIESSHEISCAEIKLADIEFLPTNRRIEAMANNTENQVIMGGIMTSLFISKVIHNHGGKINNWIKMGIFTGVIILTSFLGWINNGIVFAAIFITIIASLIMSNVRQNEVEVINQGDFE